MSLFAMTRWRLIAVGAGVLALSLALAWLQFGGTVPGWVRGQRAELDRERATARETISGLAAENQRAREDLARLKARAAEAEREAARWRRTTELAQAEAAHARGEVERLKREREALRPVGTFQEALQELRRLGF